MVTGDYCRRVRLCYGGFDVDRVGQIKVCPKILVFFSTCKLECHKSAQMGLKLKFCYDFVYEFVNKILIWDHLYQSKN